MIKPTVLQVLAEKHDDWIRMASSFGLSQYDVEEIVQEMYIRVDKAVKDVDRIMYDKNKVNTFYVYTTLKHLHWQKFHKLGKEKKRLDIKYYSELLDTNQDAEQDSIMFNHFVESEGVLPDYFEYGFIDSLSDTQMCDKVDKITSTWRWYDQKIFNLYFSTDMSMRRIASWSNISLSSIFNTIDNCRDKIKLKLKEDWDFYNKN